MRDRKAGTLKEVRPGVWRLRLYIGKDPETGNPIQASKTIRTAKRGGKTAALEELKDFVAKAGQEDHRSMATFAKLMADYLAHLPRTKAQGTVETYTMYATKHILPALGSIRLRDLTAHDLDTFYAQLGEKYKPSTIGLIHAIISGALAQGERWGWLKDNPAKSARPPTIQRDDDQESISPEDVRRLIAAAEAKDDQDTAVAIFLVALVGGRRGELCGFQWGDVDWTARTIRVRRQLVPAAGGGNRLVPHPKGRKPRTEAIGDVGVALLKRYQETLRTRRGEDWEPSGWLLSYDGGVTPLRAKGFTTTISNLGKSLKPPLDVTPHDFRHFSVSSLTAGGIDRATIRNRHGHSTMEVAERYTHAPAAGDYEAAEFIGSLLTPPAAP
ncbi:MAG: integrase family protein [Acidimicrobiaceae bacterium]|nr:integrase family protein [Acidimicrobiaceae bacterium]